MTNQYTRAQAADLDEMFLAHFGGQGIDIMCFDSDHDYSGTDALEKIAQVAGTDNIRVNRTTRNQSQKGES